uniref:Transmembrane protein n=1 Tax=Medicago truncatula TaxID=3880 RepID=A2Q6B6_MEDTR|nr:hypothetical protein MtrDRAFT_AC174467g7v1 [Medicago truncatula]
MSNLIWAGIVLGLLIISIFICGCAICHGREVKEREHMESGGGDHL